MDSTDEMAAALRADVERREAGRAVILDRLARLASLTEKAIEDGEIPTPEGVDVLLRISEQECRLRGIGGF